MGVSPTQRTLDYLKRAGWPNVQVVEKWIPQAKRHRDLFGFADVLAMHPVRGHLYVQATSGSNVSARLTKLQEEAPLQVEDAIKSGARVQIYGWRKLKNKGRRTWFPDIRDIDLNFLYGMDNDSWHKAHMYLMDNVLRRMNPRTADKGDLGAYAWLDPDIPPTVMITVFHRDYLETVEWTSKQISSAKSMAEALAKPVLETTKSVSLMHGRNGMEKEIIFWIRPVRYADIA